MASEIAKKRDLPITLSNSSIAAWRQCPRSFYYKYVLRLPQKEKDYFILGTFVHYVLEQFYIILMQNREWALQSVPLTKLMGECFKEARQKFTEATAFILRDAKAILQDYLNRVIAKHKLPIKMVCENKFNIEVDGIKVTGVIDRIDFGDDGEIAIIDYKTGKKAKSPKDFADDLQLPLYAMAATKLYDAPVEKISCKLDHLKVKSVQTLLPKQETLEKALRTIVESYESIQTQYAEMETDSKKWSEVGPEVVVDIKANHKQWSQELESKYLILITRYSKYWKPIRGWYCNYCDFYKICNNTAF